VKRQKDTSPLYQAIGRRIREERERPELKMSQTKLADLLRLSRVSVVNMEKGRHRVPIDVLYDVARILSIEPHDLLPRLESSADGAPLKLPKEFQKLTPAARVAVSRLIATDVEGEAHE
jgi:transcriptional regulator with XRE-family HTH domain